jgi:hypothetical protein
MTNYVVTTLGTNLTILDATPATGYAGQPLAQLSAGEGGPAQLKSVEDSVAIAQTGGGTAGHGYRLCRFPTNAKVKKVELFTDVSLVDGGTSSTALTFGVGVVFSDSTIDGTPVAYQNQWPILPTTPGTGTTAGTLATGFPTGTAAGNYIFGTVTANTTTGAFPQGDITFGAVQAATYSGLTMLNLTQTPLVELFNFLDGRGYAMENLGYFDIFVVVTHAYNTQPAAAYNMYAKVSYTDV